MPPMPWLGFSLKHVSLLLLTFQNSALILLMHYSRIMPLVDGHRYLPSTAILISEVAKFSISITVALYEFSNKQPHLPATSLFRHLFTAVFAGDSWKLTVPAVLYTLQNSLQYIAVSNLDASTFQITYQLKILTTAIFSVLMLGRKLSIRKWLSLLFLTIGVAIIQIPGGSVSEDLEALREKAKFTSWFGGRVKLAAGSATAWLTRRSATYQGMDEDYKLHNPHLNPNLGLIAVLIACVLSGLAGVYFEKVLKDSSKSSSGSRRTVGLWTRNVQLSFYSLFPALFLGVILKDGAQVARDGFFSGYNWIVWATVAMQATGGIIVALVVNYSNNIAKNFATSISIIISCVASVFFFDLSITFHYLLGSFIVVAATWLYNTPERRPPPSIIVPDTEKQDTRRDNGFFDFIDSPRSRSPSGRDGSFSSSTPGTPTTERVHSGRRFLDKRLA